MGTAGLTAQAFGAGDDREVRRCWPAPCWSARSAARTGAAAAPIVAVARTWRSEPAVTPTDQTYFLIRIWAAPFALANFAILGSVIGRARTDLALVLQVAINLANIALSMAS
jgi:MATE family multidrug resistance protein